MTLTFLCPERAVHLHTLQIRVESASEKKNGLRVFCGRLARNFLADAPGDLGAGEPETRDKTPAIFHLAQITVSKTL